MAPLKCSKWELYDENVCFVPAPLGTTRKRNKVRGKEKRASFG